MSGKWKKRKMKLMGLARQCYSWFSLRYTPWYTGRLQQKIEVASIKQLHVGCGEVVLPDWLNVEYEPRKIYGAFSESKGAWLLNYNLHKRWPLKSKSLDFIAAAHFIEHFDLNEGLIFMQKCFDVLKPGGVIRLSCPDLAIYAQHYVSKNKTFFENSLIQEWCTFKKAKTCGQIFAAKAYDSGNSHRWFYDAESLIQCLELVGFKNACKCGRLEGKMPDLEKIELADRELETCYVEAIK